MMLSLDTAYRSFGGEVEASSTPTICRLRDSRRHQLSAIAQRGRHLGIAKHTGPLSECEIGGDDDRRALVEPADEVEQELAAGLSERKVAKFVKDDEVHPGQM